MSFEPRLPEHIDSSMLATFRTCEKKYYWSYVRRAAPTGISVDLHFGGAFAAALEAGRMEFYGNSHSMDAARAAAAYVMLREWGDYEAPDGHSKNLEACWAAMDRYLEEYPFDTDPIQPAKRHDGQPAVEFTFAIPLPIKHPETDHPMLYCGRFDMLGELANELWVVDEKTTGRSWPASWVDQWKMRGQFLGYTWAAREAGYNCKGAIVRSPLILKREIRMLSTGPMYYPDWLITKWYEQTVRDVQRLVDCWAGGHWNQDFGEACAMYSGCQDLVLCTAQNPDLWLGDFVDRMWNPLQKDPSKQEEELAA